MKSALRLADFSHAYADAQAARASCLRATPKSIALYADALWAARAVRRRRSRSSTGRAGAPARQRPRARTACARSLAARNKLTRRSTTAQAALGNDAARRRVPPHGRLDLRADAPLRGGRQRLLELHQPAAQQGSQREGRLGARRGARSCAAFGTRPPLQIDPARSGKLHTVPFRVVNEKIIVKAQVNRGPRDGLRARHRLRADGRSRARPPRAWASGPIVNILSAGVGDLGLRELQLTRLDELEDRRR